MKLSDRTIQQVRERADLVEIIEGRVALKKSGRNNLVGLCPFHNDKSPSLSVSPERGLYHCFSCGAGGDAIKFIQELDGKSFADTVIELADRYGVAVELDNPERQQQWEQERSRRSQQYEILSVATDLYKRSLRDSRGSLALDYLFDIRSLDNRTLERFQFGYAPDEWDFIYRSLCQERRFSTDLVESVGLIVPRSSGSGYYDRFRGRVMIPVKDERGRVVGFGARALDDEQKPKYLNSPESELFDKSSLLFPLDLAKDAIKQQDSAIVVEGFFDAIALHEAGVNHVVASQGTALQEQQILKLCSLTEGKRIYLNFDSDAAGQAAIERAIANVGKFVDTGFVSIRVVDLGDYKDADEYLKEHGVEAYRELLNDAPTWLGWQIEQACKRDLSQPEEFQKAGKACVNLLASVTDSHLQTLLIGRAAELLANGDARSVGLMQDRLVARLKRTSDRTPKVSKPAPEIKLQSALDRASETLLLIALHADYRRGAIGRELATRKIEITPGASGKHLTTLLTVLAEPGEHEVTAALNQQGLQGLLLKELPEDTLQVDLGITDALNAIEREQLVSRHQVLLSEWQDCDDRGRLALLQQEMQAVKLRLEEIR
ncbi:MAG: DNA primase [Cyanobacteria bacterium J06607_13]